MRIWNKDEIRARINEILPEGKVVPKHEKNGHFYQVNTIYLSGQKDEGAPIYPSVTGKLQILKDEGLMNYKMNRAIESLKNFMFSNYKILGDKNDGDVMTIIEQAAEVAGRVSQDILQDAGDVGTRIHNLRESIFNTWIQSGTRPSNFVSFIPPEEVDVRVVSAIRALQKFCVEKDYIPVHCELLLYSHRFKVAGTLDDLGLMRRITHASNDPVCLHTDMLFNKLTGKHACLRCEYKYRYEFVLMDIKTSNQLKDHYFFQVSLYWKMFWALMGKSWKPERCIIVRLSKEDGSYKIEDLKRPAALAQYCVHMLKTNEAVEFIKSLRKDNQRVVVPLE